MPTNSKGIMFISYRRLDHRTNEAVLLRNALRDRGIPTWRDIDNLESKPTEDELIKVLRSDDTSGAVMLIAKEVADSTMIKNVEAPRIFKRHNNNDGFIIKPVLIDVGYEKADQILNSPAGFQDLGNWNLHKADGETLTEEQARLIANDILKERLDQISIQYKNHPLDMRINSRTTPNPDLNALRHDFSRYFEGRDAKPGSYQIIECALKDTADAIARSFGEAVITSGGFSALPIGVLFGAIFSPLRRFRLSWMQAIAGQDEEPWSLSDHATDISPSIRVTKGDTGSEEIILAIGVSANIEHAVTEYINASDLSPRASVYCEPPNGPIKQGISLSPQDGLSISLKAIDAVRDLKDELMLKRINLHIFLACPLAMAVLVGQKLNTISKCSLYEHTPTNKFSYVKVHTFSPSDF